MTPSGHLFSVGPGRLRLISGDITRLCVDAVVTPPTLPGRRRPAWTGPSIAPPAQAPGRLPEIRGPKRPPAHGPGRGHVRLRPARAHVILPWAPSGAAGPTTSTPFSSRPTARASSRPIATASDHRLPGLKLRGLRLSRGAGRAGGLADLAPRTYGCPGGRGRDVPFSAQSLAVWREACRRWPSRGLCPLHPRQGTQSPAPLTRRGDRPGAKPRADPTAKSGAWPAPLTGGQACLRAP
jgi:hypothetical protein